MYFSLSRFPLLIKNIFVNGFHTVNQISENGFCFFKSGLLSNIISYLKRQMLQKITFQNTIDFTSFSRDYVNVIITLFTNTELNNIKKILILIKTFVKITFLYYINITQINFSTIFSSILG
ncbi:hypothetical protein BpHYR1_014881 [Brachionus plicatilis]|uniref:Uncharacterized protein n=1 Tax=Brachionus plicatilis TaxID=10195 RepID=A0A3M7T8D5_BRAPC|nr:hypothetical protein BpHYR1_014881 [Brachionus plicatilis]